MAKRGRDGHPALTTNSIPVLPSELDLFADRHKNMAVTSAEWLNLKPVNAISNTNVSHLEFVSTGEGHRYRNLNHVYLRLRVRLTKPDGTALPMDRAEVPASSGVTAQAAYTAPKFAIINNGLHSIINSINVFLNGVDINASSDFYAFRAYIETMLTFSALHGYERLGPEFYHPSPDNSFGETVLADETNWPADFKSNYGLKWRFDRTKENKTLEMYGRLFLDLSTMKCLIPGNVDMRIKINLNDPDFFIVTDTAGETARLFIDDASLMTQVCSIQPSLLLAHERAFQTRSMNGPFKKTQMKQFVVPGNLRSFSLSNCWVGSLPRLVLFAMVDQNSASGDITKNPMVFKHYSLSSVMFDVNGKQTKIEGLSFNQNQNLYAAAFVELYSALNMHRTPEASVSYHDFIHGKFVLAADLSATLEGLNHDYAPSATGSLRVEANFAEALPHPITVLLMGIFDSTLYIDKDRNCSYSV